MKKALLVLCLLSLGNLYVFAQDDSPKSEGQSLEDKIQNPIANMISVPVQYNLIFNDRNSSLINVQPVIPITISKDWLLITRTIIPISNVPMGFEDRDTGVGNIILTTALTPGKPKPFTWGIGPAFIFPTITENFGFRDVSVGPSFGALNQVNGWTYGGFIQNFFGVAGAKNNFYPDRPKHTNYFYAQIAISKKLKKGWYVNSGPIITSDWNAPSDSQWTVPIGAGFGKLIKAKTPMNASLGFYKYLEHPQDADWFVRAQLTFILKTS